MTPNCLVDEARRSCANLLPHSEVEDLARLIDDGAFVPHPIPTPNTGVRTDAVLPPVVNAAALDLSRIATLQAFVAALELATKFLLCRANSLFPDRTSLKLSLTGEREMSDAKRRNWTQAFKQVPPYVADQFSRKISVARPRLTLNVNPGAPDANA